MIDPGADVPWWMAGGLFAAWAVRELWGALKLRRTNRTETDANIDLLNSLRQGLGQQAARIKTMEENYTTLADRLDKEILARQAAQEEAHRLRLRVHVLESAMRQVGAVIPPEMHP